MLTKPHFIAPTKRLPEVKPVTVCIAATCKITNNFDTLVCVADMKLSQHHYSEDVATIKLRKVHQNWYVMIAGAFGQRRHILEDVKNDLNGIEMPSLRQAEGVFIAAYQRYGRQLANESILAPYGLDIEQFLSRRSDLGDVIYERMLSDIGRVRVGCDLLVCGFGESRAHIFSVTNPTVENPSFVTYHDDLGFGAIGSGAYIAESTLYSFGQNFTCGIEETIYHSCSAKFSAETATDVGQATYLRVLQRESKMIEFDIGLPKNLKKIWKKHRPIAPNTALKAIIQAKQAPSSGPVSEGPQ